MASTNESTVAPVSAPEVDTDVVVVGAGPIGLALAAALVHHGVRFRVFEQRTQVRESSRANNLWARPQELLAAVSVREALAEKAYVINRSSVVVEGKAVDQPADESSSPYSRPVFTGQDVIETTLERIVGEGGPGVERGRTVLSITQDDHGVDLVVGDARPAEEQEGRGERVRCRYLVGADGVQGTVRASIGVEVPLERFEGRATRQIDARLSWRRSNDFDQLWFFPFHHGFAGVIPIWGGYHRLFLIEDESAVPHRDPTLEEMQDRLREVSGDRTATFTDPIWFSHGRFSHGVADTYAKGRVFLAGDAGHHTIPIGGQGMNAGLHDSVGLAWRLAMTLAGEGGPEVLGSYSPERQGAHAALAADQAKGFQRLMYRGRLGDAVLEGVTGQLPNLGTRIFGGGDLQQVEVAYPDSPLSREHLAGLLQRGGPRAGGRAPDAPVVAEDGTSTHLFDAVYNPDGHTWGWCLLGFDGGADGGGPRVREQLAAALGAASRFGWVHPRLVVGDAAATGEAAGPVARLFDLDGVAHALYGLTGRPALVLVRPDGHIAFRGAPDRPELLDEHLGEVISGGGRARAGSRG